MISFGYEVLKDMKYLKACLCESMRLYSPVAWDSKHAVDNDILWNGARAEKGDRVTYFPYGDDGWWMRYGVKVGMSLKETASLTNP